MLWRVQEFFASPSTDAMVKVPVWLVYSCFLYILNVSQNPYMTEEEAFFRDRLELLNSEPRASLLSGQPPIYSLKSVHFQLRNTALGFASFRKE